MTERQSRPIAITSIFGKEKSYKVHTINRQCSAFGAHDLWYNETIVWEYNSDFSDEGKMVEQETNKHCALCKKYIEKVELDRTRSKK